MSSGTKWLMIALISTLIVSMVLLIVVVEPKPNTMVQHPVEQVDFVRSESTNPDEIFIQTDRENFIVSTHNINFVQESSGTESWLDEVKYASARSAFGVKPYNLHIPEDQIETINASYLKTFGEDIVFLEDENAEVRN